MNKEEYILTELGQFSEEECKAIKDELQGCSYMKFDVGWINISLDDCFLTVITDFEAPRKDILTVFLNCALSTIYELKSKYGECK